MAVACGYSTAMIVVTQPDLINEGSIGLQRCTFRFESVYQIDYEISFAMKLVAAKLDI